MKAITETDWSGWNPSACDNADPTPQTKPLLLKMDNLTQDELGNLRLAKGSRLEATNQFPKSDIYNLFSAYLNGVKTRFVYASQGVNSKAIMCTENDPRNFSKTLTSQAESSQRCDFLNALGNILMCAGSIQRKYDGTNNFPISIPAPPAPKISGAVDIYINANNQSTPKYNNWTKIKGTTFDKTQDDLISGTAAPAPFKVADELIIQTDYASPLDTTKFLTTGRDTPDDIFSFNFAISDAEQLRAVKIEFGCTDTPESTDYFWAEWDFPNGSAPYTPFSISTDEVTVGLRTRSEFFAVGNPDWTKIKYLRVTIMITNGATAKIGNFFISRGVAPIPAGTYNYVAVQVNKNDNFIEMSPASPIVSVDALEGGNISFDISPATNSLGDILPLDSQANEYWLFRQDPSGGGFYRVASFSGSYGFTPQTITDNRTLEDILTDAAINPLYTLQYYRQNIPNNILGMAWFRDRIIYLTEDGFVPSFKFDPGSYDSRFYYQLGSTTGEKCLFITKLDVGTFIVATTTDFYRVTGTFSLQIDPADLTGQTQYLDVTVTPLGISNPAIHHSFIEYEGSILYVSITGIRILTNGTSYLINDQLDLLFRNESRYNLSPIQLQPMDQSVIAVASQGKRIYWSLPHADGINRIYVLTLEPMSRSWRPITLGDTNLNPTALFREADGLVIYAAKADPLNYIFSLETTDCNLDPGNAYNFRPVKVKTQFNYCGNSNVRKDLLNFRAKVDTGNNIANLTVYGMQYDGSIELVTVQFSSTNEALLELDLKEKLPPSIAYAVEVSSFTDYFNLDWFTFVIEERAAGTRRVIQFYSNFGNPRRKKIAVWPFLADTLGNELKAIVRVDGVEKTPQLFTSNRPQTFYWLNTEDLSGVDWEIELVCNETMEFYKLHPPDVQQIYPIERIWDQIGPLDFNKKGLVYGARFRLQSSGNVHYKVYDSDTLVYENDITIVPDKDIIYIEQFPKGIDPSVCRVVLSAPQIFYRFSVEYQVRFTGNDTEERFVMVSDNGSSSK